ncbi:hypothetical protein BCR33DRAFT_855215 [Rhizoclosmatium globosum]|uniref:C2H2-type domain-containing protein n=1 Tax=Rhizoclosmatium globosum TaxID=329046 RepID=A0A1Y2BNZ4_9FUNG|nr:hypothetical protein BCR33DRAFT_855215 [Rhizoclosmatium globosum]|eukprot:ORY36471.1 hypothetical protein BCR33DRAFT_855215 [Rhizoclosmatium globosum]
MHRITSCIQQSNLQLLIDAVDLDRSSSSLSVNSIPLHPLPPSAPVQQQPSNHLQQQQQQQQRPHLNPSPLPTPPFTIQSSTPTPSRSIYSTSTSSSGTLTAKDQVPPSPIAIVHSSLHPFASQKLYAGNHANLVHQRQTGGGGGGFYSSTLNAYGANQFHTATKYYLPGQKPKAPDPISIPVGSDTSATISSDRTWTTTTAATAVDSFASGVIAVLSTRSIFAASDAATDTTSRSDQLSQSQQQQIQHQQLAQQGHSQQQALKPQQSIYVAPQSQYTPPQSQYQQHPQQQPHAIPQSVIHQKQQQQPIPIQVPHNYNNAVSFQHMQSPSSYSTISSLDAAFASSNMRRHTSTDDGMDEDTTEGGDNYGEEELDEVSSEVGSSVSTSVLSSTLPQQLFRTRLSSSSPISPQPALLVPTTTSSTGSSIGTATSTTTPSTTTTTGQFKCPYPDCDKLAPSSAALRSHLRCHTSAIHECPHCTASFRRKHDLQRHVRSKHFEDTSVYKHYCEFCLKRFPRADTLKRHLGGRVGGCATTMGPLQAGSGAGGKEVGGGGGGGGGMGT